MLESKKYVDDIEKLLAQENLSKPDVSFLMTNFRKLIESKNLQEKFKFLNLYCNWNVHTKITQSLTGFNILLSLTESLIRNSTQYDETKALNDAIIENISFHKLLNDIKRILIENKILNVVKFLNLKYWEVFVLQLVEILIEDPIKFPTRIENPKVQKIYDLIVAKAKLKNNHEDYVIVALSFEIYDKLPCYKIETLNSIKKNFKIMGQIGIVTQEMVDNYDYSKKPEYQVEIRRPQK